MVPFVTQNLGHEVWNHSKGIFGIKYQKPGASWGTLLVHARGIDGKWKTSEGAISSPWSTCKKGGVPQLLQGMRIWQWKWHNGNSKGYLSLTGHALSKCLKGWSGYSRSENWPSFQTQKIMQIHVNTTCILTRKSIQMLIIQGARHRNTKHFLWKNMFWKSVVDH